MLIFFIDNYHLFTFNIEIIFNKIIYKSKN